ncbi:MBL fold metallo-hydrolase [Labrys okinawensis]|uniref:MBL fold metallo-hydrolase n=1 Tax=Labrys okinawensis TaxID=346911 RepID=UPI0039BD8725
MGAYSKPDRQPCGVQHIAIGEAVVSVVNDGTHPVDFPDLVTTEPEACEKAHRDAFCIVPPSLTISCFVIRSGGRLVLVDTGFGSKTPATGRLLHNLRSIGIAPDDIDTVLMTHMHQDHDAGLVDSAGKPVFTRAELVLHENEYAFWGNDGERARATGTRFVEFGLAEAAFAAYGERLRTVSNGEVLPGIRAVPTPGHTPGHTAWLVDSGRDALLIWGDIIHFPGIQFAIPDASVAFDHDSAAAALARRKVLAFAAGEKLRVAGVHLDFPAFGHVVTEGSAYRFIPEIWRPVL